MSIYDPIAKDVCPKCGKEVYSEGINNGMGYVYPPFHCGCGWSDYCKFEDNGSCKQCDQYEMCNR